MKYLEVLLLIVVGLQVSANGYAQKISLSVKDVPLKTVFKEIEKQTNYKFLYTSQVLDKAPNVTIEVANASIKEVLDLVFRKMELQYVINGNTIIIRQGNSAGVKDKIRGIPKDNGVIDRGSRVAIKVTPNSTIINLKEEFELTKSKNNCLLFISSVALGKNRTVMQNKRIRQIEITKSANGEMVVYAFGVTSGRFTILRGNINEVKIVMLTDLKRTSAIVWIRNGNDFGVNSRST